MMKKINLHPKNDENIHHSFFLLIGEINLDSCKQTIEWIINSNFEDNRPDILNLVVCSPGGDLNSAFAIVDIMRGSAIPIRTIGLGQIASAGLMIFISGARGQRILTPNTSILSHQYSWGSFGKEHELFAHIKEFDLTSKRMISHYKKCTGLDEKQIREFLLPPQDMWLSASEAKKYGICDDVKDLK